MPLLTSNVSTTIYGNNPMTLPSKLFILFLIATGVSGCASGALMKMSKSHNVTSSPVYLENYIEGVITKDNTAVLCFSDSEAGDSEYIYTVTLPIQDFLTNTNKQIELYNKYHIPPFKPADIEEENLRYDCESLPNGEKITLHKGFHPFNLRHESDRERKRKAFNISHKSSNLLLSDNRTLYLSKNREIPMRIKMSPISTTETTSCTPCYAALPVTLAIDVVTLPLQGIAYILWGGWLH